MKYRKLGKAGVQVERTFLWFVGNFSQPGGDRFCGRDDVRRLRGGCELLRQRRDLRERQIRRGDGDSAQKTRLAARQLPGFNQACSGELHEAPNERNTLNRKYLIEGINGAASNAWTWTT